MRRTFAWPSFLLVFTLVGTAPAQPKGKEAPPAKDKEEALDQLVTTGELTGRLAVWDHRKKTLTLRVELKYAVPNLVAINHLQTLQSQFLQTYNNQTMDPTQKQQRLQEIQADILRYRTFAYTMKEESQDIEMRASDKLVVRRNQPPTKLDDKGRAVRYTARELRDLKGPNARIPGYKAALEDLIQDQLVTVYLTKPSRPAAPPRRGAPPVREKPLVALVLILGQADS